MDKYSPDYESFRELHKIVLETFKIFKKLCDENGLRYFAISGTTLGAALWEGIIPWDDDMDIAMPASDYIKFKKLCLKQNFLPKDYSFISYDWFGGKIHNNKTMCTGIHYINNPDLYTGVFIDLVPLIGLPDGREEQKRFIEELCAFRENSIIRERFNNIRIEYTDKQLKDWSDDLMTRYPMDKANYVMDFSDPRYILKASGFKKPILMPFEDIKIPVSSNYKDDLKIQYQNYSKYPPKEQRINKNQLLFITDIKTPYSSYVKKYKKLPSWVINAMEEWQLCAGTYYDCYLQELNKTRVLSNQDDINKVYNSKSYKLGNFILHPIKNIFKRKTKN